MMQRKSGTSFSTPIAASIAALVLEYVKQMKTDQSITEDRRTELYKSLHTREGMAKVFIEMGTPKSGDFRYLRPWVLWGEERKRHSRQKVLERLEELVEDA